MQYVAVVSKIGKPLMPCHPARVRELVRKGKAVRRFDRGLFYIQLTERENGDTQPIAVGVDPGSTKEAYTVKSAKCTFLNIQADAVTWVKDAETTSTTMRRARRYRKTPYRPCRPNRSAGKLFLPPSTRARWQWKLRVCTWLSRRYPIHIFVVEDIKATTRPGKRHWNNCFSPLQVGKDWFYYHLSRLAPVEWVQGYETAQLRAQSGLIKSSAKLSDRFEAHVVDSWVLANSHVGGHVRPDNTAMLYLVPLHFHRRQLHRLQPEVGRVRRSYGGTRSLGFKRGSWVKHPKYDVCYVGGTTGETISLHSLEDGKRLTQRARPSDLTFLCTASWRLRKGVCASSVT